MDPDEVLRLTNAFATDALGIEMAQHATDALELPAVLWELVPVITAAGTKIDQMSPVEVADATPAGKRLTESDRTRIQAIADAYVTMLQARFEQIEWDHTKTDAVELHEVAADLWGIVNKFVDLRTVAADVMPTYASAPLTTVDEWMYYHALLRAVHRAARTPLLLRGVFITAMSTIEPLVTRLIHLLLHHRSPGAYSGLADAALDKKAREFAFGGPDKWRRSLSGEFGLTDITTAVDWDRLIELWENRNTIIHRAGIVDAKYNKKLNTPIGTVIHPGGPQEVQNLIDDIATARLAITLAVWCELVPGVRIHIAGYIGPPLVDALRAGRWRLARGLAHLQRTFAMDPDDVLVAQVNDWLAHDLGLGPAAIHADVEAWDTTGLSPLYGLARLILLRHDDQAVELIHTLLADGALTHEAIATWPLFDRLHDDDRLADL